MAWGSSGIRFEQGSGDSGDVGFRIGVRFKAGSGGSRVVWCRPGARLKEGSGGSGVVWRRPGVRFKERWRGVRFKEIPEVSVCSRQVPEVPGGLAQARCKVQGRFRRLRGGAGSRKVPEVPGWCRPG